MGVTRIGCVDVDGADGRIGVNCDGNRVVCAASVTAFEDMDIFVFCFFTNVTLFFISHDTFDFNDFWTDKQQHW
jgi:hypothetical protein